MFWAQCNRTERAAYEFGLWAKFVANTAGFVRILNDVDAIEACQVLRARPTSGTLCGFTMSSNTGTS
jgi:hypothetical protein